MSHAAAFKEKYGHSILFEDGDWLIYSVLGDDVFIIAHFHKDDFISHWWNVILGECCHCKVKPPDGLSALLQLNKEGDKEGEYQDLLINSIRATSTPEILNDLLAAP